MNMKKGRKEIKEGSADATDFPPHGRSAWFGVPRIQGSLSRDPEHLATVGGLMEIFLVVTKRLIDHIGSERTP